MSKLWKAMGAQHTARLDQETKDLLKRVRAQEQELALRAKLDGMAHASTWAACEALVLNYNTCAIRMMAQERNKSAETLLKKAEVLLGDNTFDGDAKKMKLKAVTYNNLGCFYKAQKKARISLGFLERALRIEATTPSCDNPATTHLNLCTILSQLGRHREALEHACCALELLRGGDVAPTTPPSAPGTEPRVELGKTEGSADANAGADVVATGFVLCSGWAAQGWRTHAG